MVNIGPFTCFTDRAGAAAVLGVSVDTIERQVRAGLLVPVRIGNADAFTAFELGGWWAVHGRTGRLDTDAAAWVEAGESGDILTREDVAGVLGLDMDSLNYYLSPTRHAAPLLAAAGRIGKVDVFRREDVDALAARVAAGEVVLGKRGPKARTVAAEGGK